VEFIQLLAPNVRKGDLEQVEAGKGANFAI
jgi:hypothetical protein